MRTEQQEELIHKKRFGQFFSGEKIADMLFSLLPEDKQWKTIVDPMVGIGDMLVSVAAKIPYNFKMLGIEIDEEVAKKCSIRLPDISVLIGDAFVRQELITSDGWDLVITNPPYVRYQIQNYDSIMPSAYEIRKNLIMQIERISYLGENEKKLFLTLAKNYSGLADMAVPAWILCAALVKKGGYLAIVVPDTWLNRDYANPIQYLLTKCFKIETIARDTNAKWFSDAQVKTCLVVAKRDYMQQLTNYKSVNTRIIEYNKEYTLPSSLLFPHLKGAKEAKKWALEEDSSFFAERQELPYELSNIIQRDLKTNYITLSDMGINCGQGLRTGANEFFYISIEKKEDKWLIVKSNKWDKGGKQYRFTKEDIVLTLQNRSEIQGLVVSPEKLTTAVIYPRSEIKSELLDYINSAENFRDPKGRKFKEYSAVIPNEKIYKGKIIREWFRLPQFTQRHIPNLCITRIADRSPECLYICQSEDKPIAIDANMITLWCKDDKLALITMAILNSTWSKLSLELICTVMGGGALKIESSHLKKLLIPRCSKSQLSKLENAGAKLIKVGNMTEEIQNQIDNIIFANFCNKNIISQMRHILCQKLSERISR